MKNLILIFMVMLVSGCAGKTKFHKQCERYGFALDSADYAVCVERETKKVRNYLEQKEAEEKAKNDSFYRDLERKRLGLDVR